MSIVLIKNHNEKIYDINKSADVELPTKTEFQVVRTPPTQLKKFILKEIEKQKRRRKAFGALGRPKQPLPDPKAFLRKHTGKVFAVNREDLENDKLPIQKKELVPKTMCVMYEQMNKFHHAKKNYIQENVKKAISLKPKEPIRKENIDVRGDSYRIVPKEPEQVSNKIFAKIPRYLDRLIKQRQQQIESEIDRRGIIKQKCTYITRDERKKLLEGLKKNWDELQRIYQGLPILTDTIPKKARKRDLEHQLSQLEKDIVLIERHPFLYVYDDEEDMYN